MKAVFRGLQDITRSIFTAVLMMIIPVSANAVLVDRGGGLIYDTVLNVTWLKDANYAKTSGYATATGGGMSWADARTWAAGLNYGGVTGWRLPTVRPANGSYFVYGDLPSHPSNSYSGLTDLGFNVDGRQTELGYMFYVNLGNDGYYDTAGNVQPGYDTVNSGPFINLQHYFYWFGTEYEYSSTNFPLSPNFCAPPTSCAWDFVIGYGDQTIYDKSMQFFAWAVHDGDVAVNYPLSVSKAGTGDGTVTSSPTGVICGTTCSANFYGNTSVSLTAVADATSTFTGWSGNCTGTTACAVTMNGAKGVTATFTRVTYLLTVSTSGNGAGKVTSTPGGIDCSSTCSNNFNAGTPVTLTPVAATGSVFAGWTGACTGTGACVLTVNAAKSVGAVFNLQTFPLTVTKSGTGTGTVTSIPAGINCGATCSFSFNYGTSVTLTPKPDKASSFTGWGGACSGTGACVVSMDLAKTVSATFKKGTSGGRK